MIFNNFKNISALVIGDVMLDQYYIGDVRRISPEAPVPVVNVKKERYVPGGAANVVNNILGLSAKASLIGTAGNDIYRDYLNKTLKDHNINAELIESDRQTVTKIRVVANNQQIVRLDFEETDNLPDEIEDKIKQAYRSRINDCHIVIISDYAKGLCSSEICRFIINESRKAEKCVIIDPKGADWDKYRGATFITPNVSELGHLCGVTIINDNDSIQYYGQQIFRKYSIDNLLITRSEKGMTLINADGVSHIPAEAREVYDVSGAGDTVVATLAVALAAGNSSLDSVRIANKAAGVAVSKFGTAPILENELLHVMSNEMFSKIISWEYGKHIAGEIRKHGGKVVFTNGCFDILHRGHIGYLRKARQLGDALIVGINSDSSIRRIKGEERPFNNQDDRAEVLAGLESVDYIVFFNEDTPYDLIRNIMPDILAKGSDYKIVDVVGREFAKETVLIDFLDGYSSTNMINKMNNKNIEKQNV